MTDKPEFTPYTDEEKLALLDPDLITHYETERLQIRQETAELAHQFTHIGDSKEHNPMRVSLAERALVGANQNVAVLFGVVLHPDTPEDVRAAAVLLLKQLAVAGQTALDLRNVELRWEEYDNAHSSAVTLLQAIFATPPEEKA